MIDDVIFDLDSGILSLLFSETIDVSPASRVNVTDIALIDSESGSDQILLYLRDSTLITSVDALRVNISLNAFERVAAVANASFLDGTPLKLQANYIAHDISFNYNNNPAFLSITEIPDISPIVTVSATLDYNDGTLVVFFNEPVDITPLSLINTSNFHLVNQTKRPMLY